MIEGEAVSVLSRQDYIVVDEAAVLASGREAYLRVWPDDSQQDAERDVTSLGRALYQIAHSDGWDSLGRVAGLRQSGGSTAVIGQDAPLVGDPDDWPDELFETEGPLLYRQDDVFGVRPPDSQ